MFIIYVTDKMIDDIPDSIGSYADKFIIMSTRRLEGLHWVLAGEVTEDILRYLSKSQLSVILSDIDVKDVNVIHINDWNEIIKYLRENDGNHV